EIATAGERQRAEEQAPEPCADHSREPLISVPGSEENAGEGECPEPRTRPVTQHLRRPRQQVAAIDEFPAERGERPGDGQRNEQKVDVACQRRKQADVREPARESRDRRLRDVEAEALVADAGPDAYE